MNHPIDAIVRNFKEEIAALLDSNVVLTGSYVLDLHGLNLSWVPNDLDIAIYEPTSTQVMLVTGPKELGFEPSMSYEKMRLKQMLSKGHG